MNQLPTALEQIDPRKWETFSPYYDDLAKRPLTAETVESWLADYSDLSKLFEEAYAVAYVEKTLDTTNEDVEQAYLDIVEQVIPHVSLADYQLKKRLIDAPIEHIPNMSMVLRKLRDEAALFREANVPIKTELEQLSNEYDKITGKFSVEWDGETKNLSQLTLYLYDKDRAVRERAWRTTMSLWQESRDALNALYQKMLGLRVKLAQNANLDNYRTFAFREYGRFDYTPEDCQTFLDAIETVVVPAASRVYARKCNRLGVDRLRPWDVEVDPSDAPPLAPYSTESELIQKSLAIFERVDSELAHFFATMADDDLLDLQTRSGKALGGYCIKFPLRKRPFIFMNGVGIHDNVQTLLHEAGHAFHDFESLSQPLIWQTDAPMEFCEVASMSMELLAAPYLTKEHGGFYTMAEAARARIEHLEGILTFLPYMAVVDAFQHWVYTHPEAAADSTHCDQKWDALWQRYIPDIDYTGLEAVRESGWHRKLHIFQVPFYYIEYGLAQIGALQVWRNSLTNQQEALAAYRNSLKLGGTQTLPDLFAAAGVEFRFDGPMLQAVVDLVETMLADLRPLAEEA